MMRFIIIDLCFMKTSVWFVVWGMNMSNKKFQYTMDNRVKGLRLSRGLSMICYRCGEILDTGDLVYSRNAGNSKSKSKLYHIECARQVNII